MTLPSFRRTEGSNAPPVREFGPVEWTAVEAVTNGLRAAQQRCAQAQTELAALQRRRAAVLDALGLDAGATYHFEPDGADGARVYAASGDDGAGGADGDGEADGAGE